MAHVKTKHLGLWKPQDLALDRVSSQKMFVDNIDALETFAISMLKNSHAPVASIAELRAINTSDISIYVTGMTIMVKTNGMYFFDRSSTDIDDGKNTIAPTTGGGRWISDLKFIDNTSISIDDQTPTYTQASTLTNLISGETLSISMGKIMKAISDLISHLTNRNNPHSVTASQISAIPMAFSANSTSYDEDDLNSILTTAINAMADNTTRMIRVNFGMQHEHFVQGITAVITVYRLNSTSGCAIAATCSSGYPEILIKGLGNGTWGTWRNATSTTMAVASVE